MTPDQGRPRVLSHLQKTSSPVAQVAHPPVLLGALRSPTRRGLVCRRWRGWWLGLRTGSPSLMTMGGALASNSQRLVVSETDGEVGAHRRVGSPVPVSGDLR